MGGSFAEIVLVGLLVAAAGMTAPLVRAGTPASAQLSGRLVEDLTGDGVSSDDQFIQGRAIRLFRDNGDGVFNAAVDLMISSDSSRRDGTYTFRNLSAGTYFVQQALPAGWVQTAPTLEEHDIIVTPGQCGPTPKERNDTLATAVPTGLTSVALGTYRARGAIGDNNFKNLDVDFYKLQLNPGEVVEIDVDAAAFGSALDSALRVFDAVGLPLAADDDALSGGTDSHLEFTARSAGVYYVGVSSSANVVYDALSEGSGRFGNTSGEYTIEMNLRPQGADPIPVTLAAGEQRAGFDLASARVGSILGQLFVDINGNGQQEPGEPGLDGQPVVITYQGTFIFGSDTTRSIDLNQDGTIDPATESGWYSFNDLQPGAYFVRDLFSFGIGTAGWTQVSPSLDRSEQPCTGEVSNGPASDPGVPGLLPDLTVDPAHGLCDWFLVGNLLHFGQATPNIGLGPMELRAGPDLGNGTQLVYQRIYQNTALNSFIDVEAGTFTFHPEHGHIHFDDYARYALRQALPDTNGDGVPEVGEIVAGGQKTSFCLVDVGAYDLTLPNAAPTASGFGCGEVQRISVGWEDIYDPLTPGQQIEVTGLSPGQYWLEAVVDPDNHLREVNENNNLGRTLISIGVGGPSAPAGTHGVALGSGQAAADRDFAIFQQLHISGQVFEDSNADGQQNNKEHGAVGWIVFLDLNGDGVLNNPEGNGVPTALATEPWVITDNQGQYEFVDLGPGIYAVRLVPQAGQQQTTPNPAPLSARSGQSVSGVNLGVTIPN